MTKLTGLLRRNWFPISAGLLCFAWAFMAWLTVIPNQDLLADGIQVQSLLQDPRVVLAFPGQKHGGVIEYPFNILAEWIAPANYFLHSAIRPLFAFFTGFFAARLYLSFFPKAPRWSFLLAVASGPTILQGLAGPEGNRVGVWWLNANYDLSWLFLILGTLLLVRNSSFPAPSHSKLRSAWHLAAGILIGLAVYQQPTVTLLAVPLMAIAVLKIRPGARTLLTAGAGFLVGVLPALCSYVINADNTTWDPSHFPTIQLGVITSALGLDGIPFYMNALIPYALGFAPTTNSHISFIQSLIVIGWILICGFATVKGLVLKRWDSKSLSSFEVVGSSWIATCLGVAVFSCFIDPVWIYASVLAPMLWITVGVLPQMFSNRLMGRLFTIVVLIALATGMLIQNASWYGRTISLVSAKSQYLDDLRSDAQLLLSRGVEAIGGSYYDVIPISYGSGSKIWPMSNTYNRFPQLPTYLESSVKLAIPAQPKDDWGRYALEWGEVHCPRAGAVDTQNLGTVVIFSCARKDLGTFPFRGQ